jgi:hypothetical protein
MDQNKYKPEEFKEFTNLVNIYEWDYVIEAGKSNPREWA